MTNRQEMEEKTIVGGFKTAADGTEELVEITMAEMHAQGYENPHEYLEANGLRGVTKEDILERMPKSVDEGQWHWSATESPESPYTVGFTDDEKDWGYKDLHGKLEKPDGPGGMS